MQEVYISGVGMSKFGRLEGTLVDLMVESAQKALEDAGREKVDAVYVGTMNPEEFASESNIASVVADRLGLVPVPATRIETASSSGAAAFDEAIYAAASGYFKSVLTIAGEKMTAVSTAKASKILAEVIAPEERKYGATMSALAAMITRRYMDKYGMKEEDFAEVAVKNHKNAAASPYAHFNKEITVEDVMNSKVISDPLKLYDCSPISDGAASMVVTSEKSKVKLKGLGQGSEHVPLTKRDKFTSFQSTKIAAERAYKMAQIEPSDISFAELHDAFTPFEIIGSEDVGFFEPGMGWIALKEGKTSKKGSIPVNPSGGLKARGHPVGASGLAQVVEAAWQLRGEAGDRQLDRNLKYALTQSIGGLATNNMVIILEALQ
ncbi:MAG: thiolase domain-containing protein [Elusimicrobiota bacterium]|nr:thiolase domain-containing protein [Elusimicrobiota bacterium]